MSAFRITACALAMSGILGVQPAFADILQDNGFTHSYVAATVSPSITTSLVGAGAMSVKDNTTHGTFEAWCVDVWDWMQFSSSYTLKSGADYFGAAKSVELGRLATNHLGSVTDATTSGAFQMAVWEITNESDPIPYNIASGTFTTHSTTGDANTKAQLWSNSNPEPNKMSVYVWESNDSPRSQDLVVFAPVPEPETWAMMAAGLGLMGFCAIRRKQ